MEPMPVGALTSIRGKQPGVRYSVFKMEKRLLGVKEISEYIGISPQTIYNRINRGDFPIPYKKVFGLLKWEKKDVDEFLDKLDPLPPSSENN